MTLGLFLNLWLKLMDMHRKNLMIQAKNGQRYLGIDNGQLCTLYFQLITPPSQPIIHRPS